MLFSPLLCSFYIYLMLEKLPTTKGWGSVLKHNMQQRKCILILSRLMIFGEQLWIQFFLWSLWKANGLVSPCLTLGNLWVCSTKDRIIKSEKLWIPFVQNPENTNFLQFFLSLLYKFHMLSCLYHFLSWYCSVV